MDRYELTDFEWDVIAAQLPNKPRGVPGWTTGGFSTGFSGSCGRVRPGAHWPRRYAPGYGPGVNATATPTPASLREAFGSSAKVPPAWGWINASNDCGNLWGGYPDEIATAGNSYLWIEALNAGGAVTGLLVAGPYTVT